jgi:hypothetical protein
MSKFSTEQMLEGPAFRCRFAAAIHSLLSPRHLLTGRGLKIAHNVELWQKFIDYKTRFPMESMLTLATTRCCKRVYNTSENMKRARGCGELTVVLGRAQT